MKLKIKKFQLCHNLLLLLFRVNSTLNKNIKKNIENENFFVMFSRSFIV